MLPAVRFSGLQHSHHTASVLVTSAEEKQKAILSRTFATLHVQNSLRPPAGSPRVLLRPGSVTGVVRDSTMGYLRMDNVMRFLRACEQMGLPPSDRVRRPPAAELLQPPSSCAASAAAATLLPSRRRATCRATTWRSLRTGRD